VVVPTSQVEFTTFDTDGHRARLIEGELYDCILLAIHVCVWLYHLPVGVYKWDATHLTFWFPFCYLETASRSQLSLGGAERMRNLESVYLHLSDSGSEYSLIALAIDIP